MVATGTLPRHAAPRAATNALSRHALFTLGGVKRAALVVFAVELVIWGRWSDVLASRDALTTDFSNYMQAVYLISHGVLNPYDTGHLPGLYFWQDHAAFIVWPLTALWAIWPHTVTLLWIQDVASVGVCYVAFLWMTDIIDAYGHRLRYRHAAPALATAGLVLLVINPWLFWSTNFDFHTENLVAPFVLLAARDLFNQRSRRAWLWIVLSLACGDVAATIVFALGLTVVLADRRRWRLGLQISFVGIAYALFISHIHGDVGSVLTGYKDVVSPNGPLGNSNIDLSTVAIAAITHPLRVIHLLWDRRSYLYWSISPEGVIGVASPWAIVVAPLVLFEGALWGTNQPLFLTTNSTFQAFVAYLFVSVGSIWVSAYLVTRRSNVVRLFGAALLCAAVLNSVGYALTWIPETSSQWLRVSAPSARLLARVAAEIPASDEVVVSQGVEGMFAARKLLYRIDARQAPIRAGNVWFVVAPSQGIEVQPEYDALATVARLATLPDIRLVAASAGVWVLRWRPPHRARSINLSAGSNLPLPAWTSPGTAGRPELYGPTQNWHVSGSGAVGYVVSGDYWQLDPGRYTVSSRLASSTPVNLEVWDASAGRLLVRQRLLPSNSVITVRTDFRVTRVVDPKTLVFSGKGFWRGASLDRDRAMTWRSGYGRVAWRVSVYQIGIAPVSRQ